MAASLSTFGTKSLGESPNDSLAPLLENFDTENSVQLTSSAYRKPTAVKLMM